MSLAVYKTNSNMYDQSERDYYKQFLLFKGKLISQPYSMRKQMQNNVRKSTWRDVVLSFLKV